MIVTALTIALGIVGAVVVLFFIWLALMVAANWGAL